MIELAWFAVAVAAIVCGAVVGLFLHEAGHAIPIVLARGRPHITIGSDSGRTFQCGPVTMTLGFDGVRKLMIYGTCKNADPLSRRARAASIAGGPLVTVVLLALLASVVFRIDDGPLSFAVTGLLISELFRAVQTIVPKTYSRGPYAGRKSDGLRFLELVRS